MNIYVIAVCSQSSLKAEQREISLKECSKILFFFSGKLLALTLSSWGYKYFTDLKSSGGCVPKESLAGENKVTMEAR